MPYPGPICKFVVHALDTLVRGIWKMNGGGGTKGIKNYSLYLSICYNQSNAGRASGRTIKNIGKLNLLRSKWKGSR